MVLFALAWSLTAHVRQPGPREADRTVGVALVRVDASDQPSQQAPISAPAPAGPSDALFPQAAESAAANAAPNAGFGLPQVDLGALNVPLPGLNEMLAGRTVDRPKLRSHPAQTSVFGIQAVGSRFLYVFDRSGSMSSHQGRPLAAAKAELLHSLRDLDEIHQFQIIFYNEKPKLFRLREGAPALIWADQYNKRLASSFIHSIHGSGGTRHLQAIKMALSMKPDVVFFLTDADEPQLTRAELDEVKRANPGSQIHTIEFGYGTRLRRQNFLTILSAENGGRHVYLDMSQPTVKPIPK